MTGPAAKIIVFTGVAGCGKTTLGRLAAGRLNALFFDGDDFHGAGAKEKMRRGEGLTDADRLPWLHRIRERIEGCLAEDTPAVFTCSALKRKYREILVRPGEPVLLVYLKLSPEKATERLAGREDHFAGPSIAGSQFAALEEPGAEEALCLDASQPPETLVLEMLERIRKGR